MRTFVLTAIALAWQTMLASAQFSTADVDAMVSEVGTTPQVVADRDDKILFQGSLPRLEQPYFARFDGCSGNGRAAQCKGLYLATFYPLGGSGPSLAELNELSIEKMGVQLFRDNDGDVRIEYWVRADAPFSAPNLMRAFRWWAVNILRYQERFGKNGGGSDAVVFAPPPAELASAGATPPSAPANLPPTARIASDTLAASLNAASLSSLTVSSELETENVATDTATIEALMSRPSVGADPEGWDKILISP